MYEMSLRVISRCKPLFFTTNLTHISCFQIIYVGRNPKDSAVAYLSHYQRFYQYCGTQGQFFQAFHHDRGTDYCILGLITIYRRICVLRVRSDPYPHSRLNFSTKSINKWASGHCLIWRNRLLTALFKFFEHVFIIDMVTIKQWCSSRCLFQPCLKY